MDKPDTDLVLDCDEIAKAMAPGALRLKGRRLVDLACKLRKSSDGSNRSVMAILNAERRLREWLEEIKNPKPVKKSKW